MFCQSIDMQEYVGCVVSDAVLCMLKVLGKVIDIHEFSVSLSKRQDICHWHRESLSGPFIVLCVFFQVTVLSAHL